MLEMQNDDFISVRLIKPAVDKTGCSRDLIAFKSRLAYFVCISSDQSKVLY